MDEQQRVSRLQGLEARFDEFVLGGIPGLKKLGYNPTRFLELVEQCHGAVGATRKLLSDSRHTSYGFERLWDLKRLDASVEYAACLPWFEELFSEDQIYEARTRLTCHDFPLDKRLAAVEPPSWVTAL